MRTDKEKYTHHENVIANVAPSIDFVTVSNFLIIILKGGGGGRKSVKKFSLQITCILVS